MEHNTNKSKNEIILENDINSFCKKNNTNKIKDLFNELIKLLKDFPHEFESYLNSLSISEDNIQEILSILSKHLNFINIIYFKLFRERLDVNAFNNLNNDINNKIYNHDSKNNIEDNKNNDIMHCKYIIKKVLILSHVLERLSDILESSLYSKYITEMLIDYNKLLSLISIYNNGNIDD